MGFLDGKSKSSYGKVSAELPAVSAGPRLPNLGGTPPTNIRAASNIPPVCPHCGKDPTQPPVGANPDVIKNMLQELDNADGLSTWEDQFTSDIAEKLEKYGSLTPKQIATLEKIHYERVIDKTPFRR